MQLVASMDVNATIYSAVTRIQECRKVRFAVLYIMHVHIYVYEILPRSNDKSTLANTYSHIKLDPHLELSSSGMRESSFISMNKNNDYVRQ